MNVASARITEIARRPDAKIDVAEAALVLASEEYAEIDVDAYLRRFDALAEKARRYVGDTSSARERIDRLNGFLFVEEGFAGNRDDYYDPRNSYLNDVLDRRKGIPISLAMVYCELAKRLSLPVYGVSFPGHFLARHLGDPDVIIDPYVGKVISPEECARRLEGIYGSEVRFDERMLEPAGPREILSRMLNNLKQIYVEQNDFLRALRCADRIVMLQPDSPRELRDRGILYQRLECFGAAMRDLERFLALAPDDDTAPTVREALPELRRQAALIQ